MDDYDPKNPAPATYIWMFASLALGAILIPGFVGVADMGPQPAAFRLPATSPPPVADGRPEYGHARATLWRSVAIHQYDRAAYIAEYGYLASSVRRMLDDSQMLIDELLHVYGQLEPRRRPADPYRIGNRRIEDGDEE